jgi:putative membrane protein
MTISAAFFASSHYLALGLGFFGVAYRGVALKESLQGFTKDRAQKVFLGDAFWGVAALLWIATGLMRAFGGIEKGSDFYLNNHIFWTKMLLFGVICGIETKPMITFIKWRGVFKGGQTPTVTQEQIRQLRIINHIEMFLLVVMIFLAGLMARGFGSIPQP